MQPTLVRKVHSDSHKQPWHHVAKNNSALQEGRPAICPKLQHPHLLHASLHYKPASFASQTTILPRTYGICVTFGNLSVRTRGALPCPVRPNSALTLNHGRQPKLHQTADTLRVLHFSSGDMFHQLLQHSECKCGNATMPLNICHNGHKSVRASRCAAKLFHPSTLSSAGSTTHSFPHFYTQMTIASGHNP